MNEQVDQIWLDGEWVEWEQARVHIMTHTLHYGLGIFDGMRCYRCRDGRSAVWRMKDHARRFFDSARIAGLSLPVTPAEIEVAILEVLGRNGLKEGYVRPMAWIDAGPRGLYPGKTPPVRVAVVAWPWGAYLGEEGLQKGIRARFSSYTRYHVNTSMTKAKICGNYVNSVLAKMEAVADGYDEAILLDTEGYVAEGSGENLFMVRDGQLKTPPLTAILAGITRDSVITLADWKKLPLVEERFTRDELYAADEAFFTGTAAEVTPIREVDRRPVGSGAPGPITQTLQAAYFQAVRGELQEFARWLDYLPG